MYSKSHLLSRTAAFVLTGGEGDRMAPLTRRRPKALLPFAGHYRILDFTLSSALYSGLDRVHVLTRQAGDQIADYLRESWSDLNGRTAFAAPRPPLSGKRYRTTTDAVRQNLSLPELDGAAELLLLSSDHVYRMDYRGLVRFHREHDAELTIATVAVPKALASEFGTPPVVDRDGRVLEFWKESSERRGLLDHPGLSLVRMGIYVVDPQAFEAAVPGEADADPDLESDLVPQLVRRGRAFAYAFYRKAGRRLPYWTSIDSLDSYFEGHQAVLDGRFHPDARRWPVRSGMIRGQRRVERTEPMGSVISPAAVVETAEVYRSVIGPGASVGRNAYVRNSVLMPGANVGEGAMVRNAIIDEHASIPQGDTIGWDLRLDSCRYPVTESGIVVVADRDEPATEKLARNDDRAGLVLLADSDSHYLEWARDVLENEEFRVVAVQTATRLMELVVHHRAALRVVVCGTEIQDVQAPLVLQFVRDNVSNVRILVKAHPAAGRDTLPFEGFADAVLTEPFGREQLVRSVAELFARRDPSANREFRARASRFSRASRF